MEDVVRNNRNETIDINDISSTDGWTDRKGELNFGNIPKILYQQKTEQLGTTPTNGIAGIQRQVVANNRIDTILYKLRKKSK